MAGQLLRAAALLVVGLAAVAAAAERVSYRGYKKVAVNMKSAQVQTLRDENPGIDVFKIRGDHVEMLVDATSLQNIKALGMPFEVLIDDVEAHLAKHEPRATSAWTTTSPDSPFFDNFRPYEEISAYIDQLVANNSRILSKFSAGVTYEGRTIFGIKVSTGGAAKPSIYIQAQVHAREWLASPTNLYIISALVEEYNDGDASVVELIEGLDWYFVPMVNIDGYIYSWNVDRYWRKNRRDNVGTAAKGCDINRNWPPEETWCTAGSSTIPSSDTYCGTGPASESETLVRWIDNLPELRAAVDLHTYGPLILHPFQYSSDKPEEPYNGEVIRIGLEMEQGMRGINGIPFESIQGVDLYPHSGGLIDYAYFTRRAIAYTIELRGNDFVVAPSNIRPSGAEAYDGILLLAENTLFQKTK